jgi:SAM-dependent methyltransferase
MKLSDIVKYLNHLQTLSVSGAMVESMKEVTKITHIVQHNEIQIDDQTDTLISIQQDLEESLKQYEQTLTRLKQGVQLLIEQYEHKYFADSTDNYQQGMRRDTSAQILARIPNIDSHSGILLESRSKTHANWQFPGMIIRPAHNLWIEGLVALDPMYLVDTHSDLFAPVNTLFTPEYRRRLRYYVIEEYTSDRIFWNLPQEQFGVVYAFNYFNFKPWEVVKQYLDEVFVLLRPGGSFLFDFNDCDNWRAVGLTEHHYCCYTPGRLLRKHVLDLGYEIVNDHQTQTGPSWIEIRKPGILDSIRGAQALASIFKKIVDKPVKELYNAMDLGQLIKLADFLKVDISQAKTKREFNIKKVRNTISAHLETENYPEELLRELFKPKEN